MSRRTGKIASLPKVLRDQVNTKLRDGVTYAGIIDFLREDCPDLNAENVSHWFKGSGDPENGSGYQDWLKDQERLDDMKRKREFAMQIVQENEGSKIHEAAVQIAASQIYEVLTDLDPKTIQDKLRDNPEQYSRLINALAKLSDQGIKHQRYKDEVAARKERIQKELDQAKGKGGITKETLRRIEQELNLL